MSAAPTPAPTPAPSGPPDPTQATVTAALLRLQERTGWLSATDLRDLAERLGVPVVRLEEVVGFFPHFHREPPKKVALHVCRDMTCHLRGAGVTIRELESRFATSTDVEVKAVSCLGRCDRAPAACVSRHGGPGADVHEALVHGRTLDELTRIASSLAAGDPPPKADPDRKYARTGEKWRIDVYDGVPTYEATKRVLRQLREADDLASGRAQLDVIPKLDLSGLRGMGGAGVPAGKKWKDVRQAVGAEKYIVCNADESEPGTFKDREILLRTPHLVIEGIILAGLAIGATRGYVYLRHEYPEQAAALRAAIDYAERQRVCGTNVGGLGFDFPVSVFISPGGYICGEQSALIEAMEGKRAQPRNRPPELPTNGLFDKPTLVNNVETFAWAPGIVLNSVLGRDGQPAVNWYQELSPPGRGRRLFSISGDVNDPGVYEVPIGAPLRFLIEQAGGVVGGEGNLTAVATSGPSGGFLPPTLKDAKNPDKTVSLLDVEMDIDAFRGIRASLGAGLVVYSGGPDMLEQAVNATEFFRNESCGKCVPCRVGSQKLVEIGWRVRGGKADVPTEKQIVRELDRAMELTSICGLGQVAPKPLVTALQYFVK